MHENGIRTSKAACCLSVAFVGAVIACSTAACSSGDAAPGTSNNLTPDSGTGATTDSGGGGGGADTGGGNQGDSGPSATPSVCDGAGTRVLAAEDAFVDDFEEAAISPGWSSFNDITPPNSVKIAQVAGGAVGTGHAGKYAGKGAKIATAGGYGVGTVYNVAIDPTAGILCVDISAFDGVAFWAKAGTAGAKISLNFVVPQTNMAGTNDQGLPNGGDCKTKCFNHPHASVTLTADWAQYTVKFADAAGGSAKVGSVIQELAWLSPDSDWDFSLDEIVFYKGTPPAGPVGTGSTDAGAHD